MAAPSWRVRLLGELKRAVWRLMPRRVRSIAQEYILRRWHDKHKDLSIAEVFSSVYREGRWERSSDGDLSSGPGSNDPVLVQPYVRALAKFITSLPSQPSVVDLGCGDFNVGRHLRPFCANYVACDVVPFLISRNKEKFADLKVDFRCIDIIEDELPGGDVVFLRQVLQHLNNAQINKIIPKLYQYKFLVLTEHLPTEPDFPRNLDKQPGPEIRLRVGSGVVLTAPPFSFRAKSESVICTTQDLPTHRGLLRTTLYELG
jgi:SAM-dependent methyltransferase